MAEAAGERGRTGNQLRGHKVAMSRMTAGNQTRRPAGGRLRRETVGRREAGVGGAKGAATVWASAAELAQTTPVGDEDKSDQ